MRRRRRAAHMRQTPDKHTREQRARARVRAEKSHNTNDRARHTRHKQRSRQRLSSQSASRTPHLTVGAQTRQPPLPQTSSSAAARVAHGTLACGMQTRHILYTRLSRECTVFNLRTPRRRRRRRLHRGFSLCIYISLYYICTVRCTECVVY